MKNLIEMQKLKLITDRCPGMDKVSKSGNTETLLPLPIILVEDTSRLTVDADYSLDGVHSEERSQTVTLRRQYKFMKGSERPKLLPQTNKNIQASVSYQNLSTSFCKNVPNSCDEATYMPYSGIYSNMDLESIGSQAPDENQYNNKTKFKRRESYQRAISIEPSRKKSSKHKLKKTIQEEGILPTKMQLTRFSSHSNLPRMCSQ